jgi:hypothetical protein
MDYTFLVNLQTEFTLPEKGILSRVLREFSARMRSMSVQE